MIIDTVMHKYSMIIDDVLNVRAFYGGTITNASDERLADAYRMERPIHRGTSLRDAMCVSNR